MRKETTLYVVKSKLDDCRGLLNTLMYGDVENPLSEEDFALTRKIYDAICKVEDLFI